MANFDLLEQLAVQAEFVVNHFATTFYQHQDDIDVDTGKYYCDCNGFAGFVLTTWATQHFNMIPRETGYLRPRAFEYSRFFLGLTPDSPPGWSRVDSLQDAQRGDMIAWQLYPEIEPHKNTGHVVFVAEPPTLPDPSGVITLRAYDSAAVPHFDDTRHGKESGVGSGFINFQVDNTTGQTSIQFGPSLPSYFTPFNFAVGRAESM